MIFRPALVIAALMLPIAAAASETAPRTAVVSHAGLDLTSIDGQKALERRLLVAVRQVCAVPDGRNLRQLAASADCMKTARPAALASMEVAVARAASKDQMAARSTEPQS